MAPWPMDSWTTYGPSRIPGAIGTATDYQSPVVDFNRNCRSLTRARSAPFDRASRAAAPPRDETGEYRKRDLGGRHPAYVETHRRLDLRDDVIFDAFSAQGLEMVPGV